MSWPVFAVIQLGIVTLGVIVACVLRNRELRRRYADLATASDEALEAIDEAKAQLDTDAHVVWLGERVAALDGDDDSTAIQRLVLENELEANPDFAEQLSERLGAADSAQDALRAQWHEVRSASLVTASRLIQEYPLSHPVIVQLYQTFDSLDKALAIEPSTLPEPPELSDEDQVDVAQEAESLRAAKELLEKELDVLKATLDTTSRFERRDYRASRAPESAATTVHQRQPRHDGVHPKSGSGKQNLARTAGRSAHDRKR